jgi:hypothetical protein
MVLIFAPISVSSSLPSKMSHPRLMRVVVYEGYDNKLIQEKQKLQTQYYKL